MVNEDPELKALRIQLLAARIVAREAIDALERGTALTMGERERKVAELRARLAGDNSAALAHAGTLRVRVGEPREVAAAMARAAEEISRDMQDPSSSTRDAALTQLRTVGRGHRVPAAAASPAPHIRGTGESLLPAPGRVLAAQLRDWAAGRMWGLVGAGLLLAVFCLCVFGGAFL